MSDKLCPVDWDTKEFVKMMSSHLKKDEDEWNLYNDMILEWNAECGEEKPLSEFLRFIISRVAISV